MSIIQDKLNLTGKVAIVTGASKGIGEAIAYGLAQCGAQVVVSSRKQEAVDDVANRFRAEGLLAEAIAADMGKMDDVRALADKTLERFGRVDILVNNAATNPVFGPALNCDEAAFDKIMNVNVKGPFELAKRVHPAMCKNGGGAIVNISSIGGLSPEPFLGIYSVSKASLISLTQVLAKEWGADGVRANVICPGLIQTKFSKALWSNDQILKHVVQQLPISRIGQPEDVLGLAVFLCSDLAAYITGGVFTIDGGHNI